MKHKFAVLTFLLLLAVNMGFAETFRNPVRIATGADPSSVLVADLNGDGRPDIVWTAPTTTATGVSTVHTLLAQANGSFKAGPILDLPTGVSTLCQLADETRDGKLDLICPHMDQTEASIMVFPGKGDGSFGSPIETTLPSSGYDYWDPVLGAPADLKGDGVADFIVVAALNQVGFVLLGKGDGTFTVSSQYPNGSWSLGQGGNQYQAIDINGDGNLDLLFAGGQVLLGDGKGSLHAVAGSSISVEGSCTFGKLAGEPHIDAACGQVMAIDGDITGGTQLLIYHGNGDGTFNATPIKTITYGDHTNEFNGFGTFLTPLAIVDLNGDGIPDILADAGDGATVLLGKKNLDFAYPAHYATGYDPDGSGVAGHSIWRLADLNGDGLPDLVQCGPNGVYISYGRPDGVFDTAPAYELTQVIGYETVADFNEDGIPDIAATGDQAIELNLGKGDGSFEYRTPLPRGVADFSTPLSATNAHILHGDFNGDHHQDIIAIGSSAIYQYNEYILFGHGDGTFNTPALVANSSQTYPMYSWQQVFDFNHDGKDDLFSTDSSNLYVALSKGGESFKTITTPYSSAALAESPQTQAAIADLKGNGKLDAVLGGQSNLLVFSGNGDGSFSASPTSFAIPSYQGTSPQGSITVAAGDFDGDGHKDIALLAKSGVLYVFFGKGDGTFNAAIPVGALNYTYTNLYAADLNKGGLDDLVLKTSGSLGGGYAVGIIHSLAGRKFGPEINYYAGTGLADLAIVDLNGDGFPDLVFGNGDYNIAANSATVLMNLGNSAGVKGSVYALPDPSIAGSPFQLVASFVAPAATLTGNVNFSVDGKSVGAAALKDNQAAFTVSNSYAAGLHTLKATWAGSSKFAAVTLIGRHQVIAGYPVSATLVTSRNPAPFLTPVTLTATVESTSGTPSGSISFLDGKSSLATVALSGGSASYTTSSLVPANHTITAKFLPAAGWAAASATLMQEIDPIDATTTLTFNPQTVYAMQPIAVSVAVSSPGPVPTGSITLTGDSATVGVKTLVNGKTAFSTFFNSTGYHSLSAQYSGNQDYNSGGSNYQTVNVLVNPTLTSLQAVPNPAVAAQPVTITARVSSTTGSSSSATGAITFYDNGGQIGYAQLANGKASITLNSLDVGTHPLQASYSGDTSFSASQSGLFTLVVNRAPALTKVTASPNPAKASKPVTLAAQVTGPRQPTGSVRFYDGSKALSAEIAVDFYGKARFTTSSLAAGAHSIVAKYFGDPNLNPSSSAPLQVTINP